MKLVITIDTANAAFEDNGVTWEVSRILMSLARKIEDIDLESVVAVAVVLPIKLRDSNGNTVGTCDASY